jgi:hypothetical protein
VQVLPVPTSVVIAICTGAFTVAIYIIASIIVIYALLLSS